MICGLTSTFLAQSLAKASETPPLTPSSSASVPLAVLVPDLCLVGFLTVDESAIHYEKQVCSEFLFSEEHVLFNCLVVAWRWIAHSSVCCYTKRRTCGGEETDRTG